MWENLQFSLGCVLPFFFLIVAGYFCARTGLASREFLSAANRFTFRVALPVHLFLSSASIHWEEDADLGFVGYILAATLVCYGAVWLITELVIKDKTKVGTLVQGSFRGNFVLLGIPLANAVLGTSSAAAKATLVSAILVPLYNLLSVLVLLARGKQVESPGAGRILLGIVKNPLIIGAVAGCAFSLLGFRLPAVAETTLDYIGRIATPLGLISIGGIFNWRDATARLKLSLYAVLFKNFLLSGAMIPLSYLLGYRGEELVIVLVAFAAPVAVSSYAMADQLGGDGPLAANIMIITTLLSAFVLAGGIYLMRALGWI